LRERHALDAVGPFGKSTICPLRQARRGAGLAAQTLCRQLAGLGLPPAQVLAQLGGEPFLARRPGAFIRHFIGLPLRGALDKSHPIANGARLPFRTGFSVLL
jgi:hypothetical protein